ncbi:MAG: hypothetical protein HQ474_03600 [Flammeovirgaceae bacterium]|nr:hypothetical protein [Flammeovirgaceae bacterium]
MRLNLYCILFFISITSIKGQIGPIVSSGYHDVTARYNSYFIAKEKIKEIEKGIFDKYQWNYNKILPIYSQFDTTDSKSLESLLKDCIEKASMAIQRHPESKWEDDAYILVGKARMYGSEFPEAIETFKWINKFGENKDIQHLALSELIRTFCEAQEYENAQVVIDYLKNEKLSDKNKLIYYLNRAYYYQKIESYTEVAQNLKIAQNYLKKDPDRARIEFISGQVHQEIKDNDNAYYFYRQSMKHSKTYELSFFSKLNLAGISPVDEPSSTKKSQKYFKKLLKDRKNTDYKDKIYYQMAERDYKSGDLTSSIHYYKMSISSNVSDARQKSYAYLKLADIYYEHLLDFRMAKAYYDSTINVLPKDEKRYAVIKNRQEVLSDFVLHLNTISNNDSLIGLVSITPDSLEKLINQTLYVQEAEATKKKEKAETLSSNVNFYTTSTQVTISASTQGEWYFYNTLELSRGLSEFKRKWGQRTLNDNWRRSTIINKSVAVTNNPSQKGSTEKKSEDNMPLENTFSRDDAKSKLLAAIPTEDSQMQKLLSEIEIAYYELGKIYNFKLNEPLNAIHTFDELLRRFPGGRYSAEVLYQLYLLNKDYDSLSSIRAADQLVLEYPDSIYSKLVFNPNYLEDNDKLKIALQKIYTRAYDLYGQQEFLATMNLLDSTLASSPENEFIDYLLLLRAICFGKLDSEYKYQFELNNFVKNRPTSPLVDYAKTLIATAEEFQINLFSASKAKYIPDSKGEHYLMYLYPSGMTQSISLFVDSYLDSLNNNLKSGNMLFDEKYSLILITPFNSKLDAQLFKTQFKNIELTQKDLAQENLVTLIITKANFDIFYKTKDLETYLSFFEQYYSK